MTKVEIEIRVAELKELIRIQKVRMKPYFDEMFRRYHLLVYGAGVPDSERLKALEEQRIDYFGLLHRQMQRTEPYTAELAKLSVRMAEIRQAEHRAKGGGQGCFRMPAPRMDFGRRVVLGVAA